MNDRSPSAGPKAYRQPPLETDAAAAWPILAHVPFIDESREASDADSGAYFHASESAANRENRASTRSRRIDAEHRNRRPEIIGGGDGEPMTPAERRSEPSARRIRVDAASRFGDDTAMPSAPHHTALTQETTTIASRIFQWHAALAPHAGLAMTAALVIAVGALCWATFGARPEAPSARSKPAPLWPDQPAPLTLNSSATPLAPLEDLSQFCWSAKPMPKPVPATIESESPNSAAGSSGKPPASPAAATTLDTTGSFVQSLTPSSETAGASTPSQPSKADEPITPTPSASSYPSTPFSAFDYESLRLSLEPPNGAVPPAVMAAPVQSPQ